MLRWGDYPDGLIAIIRVLISNREAEGDVMTDAGSEKLEDATPLTLKMEEGLCAKECRQRLEAGKGKEMDSPWCFQKGMRLCQHLDLGTMRPILDFWTIKL